jgi:pyruvate/2-oxoglutarate dehydrogenase complex dihydrolipoamide dehydrogenase (E3) component
MKNAKKFGLPEIDVPRVYFKRIAKRIQSVIHTIQEHDSVERFCRLEAQGEFGSPEFTDDHTVRLNGKSYSSNKVAISTGSSPFIPQIERL